MGILRSRDYAPRSHYHHAFSLVELVMVVTILGIIAAIAVPRMTTAATNASSNALQATLANVRKVIDVYYAEHGRYPGYDPATGLPNNDAFVDQLLLYTDSDGKTNATYAQPFIYGPYLRAVPPFPISGEGAAAGVKGDTTVAAAAAAGVAWIYDESAGTIIANAGTADDASGKLYTAY